ncbi:hypothetical protein [Muribaculum sp.]|uniref:hypothetical protein n=1 Tax=Muribaculum sp. TaxID=1918611 RepID=UPI0023C7D1E1|nr:hypothetical protein [Muribaculum sp.]MDE5705845.1 hypothetical protein [Muribaculum sp.]
MFKLIFEQSGPTGDILRGVSMLTIFLIVVIAILMFLLIIHSHRELELKRKNRELAQMRSPVYTDIIRQGNDRIDTLCNDITNKEETIEQLKSTIDRLTSALYHDCKAWPKINALQCMQTPKNAVGTYNKNSCKTTEKVHPLNQHERDSLLHFIHLCRNDITVYRTMLTDDDMILYHLLTSGLTNAAIAALIGITPGTLRQRKLRLMRKLGDYTYDDDTPDGATTSDNR